MCVCNINVCCCRAARLSCPAYYAESVIMLRNRLALVGVFFFRDALRRLLSFQPFHDAPAWRGVRGSEPINLHTHTHSRHRSIYARARAGAPRVGCCERPAAFCLANRAGARARAIGRAGRLSRVYHLFRAVPDATLTPGTVQLWSAGVILTVAVGGDTWAELRPARPPLIT